MSVRYTGEALAMSPVIDDVALRDVEPWKDRLEVRLDNRQVFFLFFGSAMVACLLFVLGVIVGKKLETRGRAEAPAIEDPLAILDRLGSQGPMPVEQAVTFPKALTTPPAVPRTHVAALAPTPVREVAREVPRAEPRPESAPPAVPHAKPSLPTATAAPAPRVGIAKIPPAAPPAPKVAAAPAPTATAAPSARAPAPVAAPSRLPSAAPVTPPASAASAGKGRFTLQLSAFQDRSEAEAMVRKLGAGHASVVATEIPGKGTWYRVRAGSFTTFQEASSAKAAFERDHNIIAYVASSAPPVKP